MIGLPGPKTIIVCGVVALAMGVGGYIKGSADKDDEWRIADLQRIDREAEIAKQETAKRQAAIDAAEARWHQTQKELEHERIRATDLDQRLGVALGRVSDLGRRLAATHADAAGSCPKLAEANAVLVGALERLSREGSAIARIGDDAVSAAETCRSAWENAAQKGVND